MLQWGPSASGFGVPKHRASQAIWSSTRVKFPGDSGKSDHFWVASFWNFWNSQIDPKGSEIFATYKNTRLQCDGGFQGYLQPLTRTTPEPLIYDGFTPILDVYSSRPDENLTLQNSNLVKWTTIREMQQINTRLTSAYICKNNHIFLD